MNTNQNNASVSVSKYLATDEQVVAYCDALLTGKAIAKPFSYPMGKINFSRDQKDKIREARKLHRLALASIEAKSAVIESIRGNAWKLLGFRENVAGNRRALRFGNFSNGKPFAYQRAVLSN